MNRLQLTIVFYLYQRTMDPVILSCMELFCIAMKIYYTINLVIIVARDKAARKRKRNNATAESDTNPRRTKRARRDEDGTATEQVALACLQSNTHNGTMTSTHVYSGESYGHAFTEHSDINNTTSRTTRKSGEDESQPDTSEIGTDTASDKAGEFPTDNEQDETIEPVEQVQHPSENEVITEKEDKRIDEQDETIEPTVQHPRGDERVAETEGNRLFIGDAEATGTSTGMTASENETGTRNALENDPIATNATHIVTNNQEATDHIRPTAEETVPNNEMKDLLDFFGKVGEPNDVVCQLIKRNYRLTTVSYANNKTDSFDAKFMPYRDSPRLLRQRNELALTKVSREFIARFICIKSLAWEAVLSTEDEIDIGYMIMCYNHPSTVFERLKYDTVRKIFLLRSVLLDKTVTIPMKCSIKTSSRFRCFFPLSIQQMAKKEPAHWIKSTASNKEKIPDEFIASGASAEMIRKHLKLTDLRDKSNELGTAYEGDFRGAGLCHTINIAPEWIDVNMPEGYDWRRGLQQSAIRRDEPNVYSDIVFMKHNDVTFDKLCYSDGMYWTKARIDLGNSTIRSRVIPITTDYVKNKLDKLYPSDILAIIHNNQDVFHDPKGGCGSSKTDQSLVGAFFTDVPNMFVKRSNATTCVVKAISMAIYRHGENTNDNRLKQAAVRIDNAGIRIRADHTGTTSYMHQVKDLVDKELANTGLTMRKSRFDDKTNRYDVDPLMDLKYGTKPVLPFVGMVKTKNRGYNHCLAFCNGYLFDPEYSYGMLISKRALDACCGGSGQFDGFFKGYHFITTQTKAAETKNKRRRRKK